jgi:hypothetical protein
MYEVYRHKTRLRYRLYKLQSAPMPRQARADAWELVRNMSEVDDDVKKGIVERGYSISRVDLTWLDLRPRARSAKSKEGGSGTIGERVAK